MAKKYYRFRKRFIKPIIVSIILLIVVYGFAMMNQNNNAGNKVLYPKVLIIGIDGMDPIFAKTMMEQGRLQNFARLSQKGTFLNLNTSYPPETPVAWTSIATGKNPGKHGIFDYIKRDTGSYVPELSIAKLKQTLFGPKYLPNTDARSFWEITSENGIPTTIIRWPITFPPSKIRGNMLSGLGVPDIKGFLGGYTIYSEEETVSPDKATNRLVGVENNKGKIYTSISGPNKGSGGSITSINADMIITFTNGSNALIEVNGKQYEAKEKEWTEWIKIEFNDGPLTKINGIAKAYLASAKPFRLYLTAVNIDPGSPIIDISYPKKYSKDMSEKIGIYATLGMPEETDGYVDGNLEPEAFLQYVRDIENEKEAMFWVEFDKFRESKKGVYAFVFDASDRLQHVMTEKSKKMTESAAIAEYYLKKDEFLGKVLDNLDNQTLLLIVSDHGFSTFEKSIGINNWLLENGFMSLKEDLDSDNGALFQNVDWSRTKAYSLGFTSIYINLKGREQQGIIEPEDKQKIMEEIKAGLLGLKDDNGSKVFNGIYKSEELYKGKYKEMAPDMIIGFNPGYRMAAENAIGGFSKEVINNNDKKWAGDHLIDPIFVPGVLFSNAKFNLSSASLLDIAPTVLDSLGIPADKDIDGQSMFR